MRGAEAVKMWPECAKVWAAGIETESETAKGRHMQIRGSLDRFFSSSTCWVTHGEWKTGSTIFQATLCSSVFQYQPTHWKLHYHNWCAIDASSAGALWALRAIILSWGQSKSLDRFSAGATMNRFTVVSHELPEATCCSPSPPLSLSLSFCTVHIMSRVSVRAIRLLSLSLSVFFLAWNANCNS